MSCTTQAAKDVLAQLPECPVWEPFLRLVEIPRPSGHHAPVVEFLENWAKEQGFEYATDAAKNVVIRVPATPGYENVPVIALQGHSDIVGVAESGFTHDFKNDPLVPRIHEHDDGKGVMEKWLMATNTSLGADNGIAIAAGMAIAVDKSIIHGPLELLVTADEEIGLLGAAALKDGFVNAEYVLNLDSEEECCICVGCAGGNVNRFTLPVTREACDGAVLNMKLWNLSGGHTGVDIDNGNANALLLSARILKACLPKEGRVITMNGGQAHNAIPREMLTTVVVPEAAKDKFVKDVEELVNVIRKEFVKTDGDIKLDWPATEGTLPAPLTAESTAKFIDFTLLLPFRPYRMSQAVDGLVETSYATTIVADKGDSFLYTGSARSDSKAQLNAVYNELTALTNLAGIAPPTREDEYPGWPANPSSYLLKVAEAEHMNVVGKKADVLAIHAGLECGLLLEHCPTVKDAVSIGPELRNPHSPSEQMMIRTVVPFFDFVKAILKTISEEKK